MSTAPSNEQVEATFLQKAGLSPIAVAGMLANSQVESGFDPTKPNAQEGAIGIAQWEGGRRTRLEEYAKQTGGSETSLTTQLGFMMQELNGPYSQVLEEAQAAATPAQAAAIFDVGPGGPNSGTGYENSSGSTTGRRETFAGLIYNQLNSGATLTGGGAASDASSSNSNTPPKAPRILGISTGPILDWVIKGIFIAAGLTLVALGLYRSSTPAHDALGKFTNTLGLAAAA